MTKPGHRTRTGAHAALTCRHEPSRRRTDAALAAALDAFARRFKLADIGAGRPLAEIDKHVLQYVEANPDCGLSDVARFLRVAMTTVCSATDRLAKRGLLERLRPSDDRRAVALRLTEDGVSTTDIPIPDDPRVSLLDRLRERAHLTGTKLGCNSGSAAPVPS